MLCVDVDVEGGSACLVGGPVVLWSCGSVDGVDGVLSLVVKVQVLESHITIRRLYSIKSFHLVSEEGCMNYEKIRLKNGKNRFVQRVLYKYFH